MSKANRPRIWKHLLSILEIQHHRNGEVIWEEKNVPNIFNEDGEEFVLSCVFDTDAGFSIPSFYYLGLDNRSSIDFADNMSSITGEPTTNGYSRQALSSSTGFSVAVSSGHMKATSGIVTFQAVGGSWGPVSNAFLTTASDSSGTLISSVALSSTRTLVNGDQLTARLGLALQDC